jgi:hypothetical protein
MRNILHNMRAFLSYQNAAGAGKLESVESAQDTLRAAHSTFLACINLKAAADSAESNHVIKTLTVLLAFTTPLNLIASIFGMVGLHGLHGLPGTPSAALPPCMMPPPPPAVLLHRPCACARVRHALAHLHRILVHQSC